MKKKAIFTIMLCAVSVIMLGIIYFSGNPAAYTVMSQVADLTKELQQGKTTEIVAASDTFSISAEEVQMFIANAKYEVTQEAAIQAIAEERAKYEIAIERGYSTSDEEIDQYISDVKASVKGTNSEAEQHYNSLITAYGKGEDGYWNDAREPLRRALTVAKLNKQYMQTIVSYDSITYTYDTPELNQLVQERLQAENFSIK